MRFNEGRGLFVVVKLKVFGFIVGSLSLAPCRCQSVMLAHCFRAVLMPYLLLQPDISVSIWTF